MPFGTHFVRTTMTIILLSSFLACHTQEKTSSRNPHDPISNKSIHYESSSKPSEVEIYVMNVGEGESIISMTQQKQNELTSSLSLGLGLTEQTDEAEMTEAALMTMGISLGAMVAGGVMYKGAKKFQEFEPGKLKGLAEEGARKIYFETATRLNRVRAKIPNAVGGWDAYNSMEVLNAPALVPQTGKLYLGMIPDDSIIQALKDQNVKFISVVENFEYTKLPSAIKDNSQQNLQISSPDFAAVSVEQLHVGVVQLQNWLGHEQNVYVLCKSGVGRSASVVAAYYIKNYGKSAMEAALIVKGNRPWVAIGREGNNHQMGLEDFELSLIKDKTIFQKKLSDYHIVKGSPRYNKIMTSK